MARIKNFKFKNIRSYGNKVVDIPFDLDNGLVLISGKNGGGKTSIVEALEFSIYGNSSRVPSKDLANWFNDNGYTNIVFETDDKRTVELSRGISPDFYDLKIDNSKNFNSKDKTTENKANKSKIDKMVEEELFKISQDIFANNILLSIHDFKSFIKMKPADKRKIIDKIFDTDIFNDMNVSLKKELSEYKEKYNSILEVIKSKQSTLDSTNERIVDIKSTIDDDRDKIISDLKTELESINSRINQLVSSKMSIESNISRINSEYNDYLNNVREAESALNSIYNTKIQETNTVLNDLLLAKRNDNDIQKNNLITSTNNEYNIKVNSLIKPEDNIKNSLDLIDSDLNKLSSHNTSIINENILNKNKELEQLELNFNEYLKNSESVYNDELKLKQNDLQVILSDIEKLDLLLQEKNAFLNTITSELSIVESKLKLYNEDKCHNCGSDLVNDKFHIEQKNIFESEIQKLTKDLKLIKIIIDEHSVLRNDTYTSYSKLNSETSKFISEYQISINDSNIQYSNSKNIIESKYKDVLSKIETDYNVAKAILETKKQTLFNTEKSRYDNEKNLLDSELNSKLKEIEQHYYNDYISFEKESRIAYDANIYIINEQYQIGKKEISDKTTDKINSFKNELDVENRKIININENYSNQNIIRDNLMLKLNTIENGDSIRVLTELTNIADSLDLEISKLNVELSDYEQKIWVRENTQYLIGENGLKKMIMRQILPSFNSTISKITSMFDFKYRFLFDENFDAHLTYCGKNVPITVSRGEGKIMDIIVILSTLQLILMKHSNINILFLDEIFSNLDIENIAKAVSILRDYAKKYNLTIFVMSHTPVPYEFFDRIITVSFDGTFSNIESIQ